MSETRRRINWEDVRSRLLASQQALDRVLGADAEDLTALYSARAAQLAARRDQPEGPSTAVRLFVFALGTERYALEFPDLVELLPFDRCTPVPGGPAALLGVVNVHGDIRSVVDLGRLLELPDRDDCSGGYVLVVRHQGRAVCWRVDQIDRIEATEAQDIVAQQDGSDGAALHYLKGLTPERVRVLNIDALLAHPIYS
jgi:purine-binding chemotaxis protein CheW